MPVRIGYLIPEFPGQTHIWMWREILWMQRWADALHIYSTRQPPERDRARHLFARSSIPITTFLWPIPVLHTLLWALLHHPRGLWRCLKLCFSLPIDKRPRSFHLLKLLPSACFLARDVRKRNLRHLHCHSCANCAILAMLAKRLIGVSFSMTVNANLDWWGGAMREKLHDAEFTLAITQWLLDQIHRDYPDLKPTQALLGRIGVDTSVWTRGGGTSVPSSLPFRIVTVARLHPCKGHDILISAVERLVRQGRNITLRLIGEGPERPHLEFQIKFAGLEDRIRLLGSLGEHQILSEMRFADAFVLASHAEPLGVAYMEAMSAGVPTIGTAAGGVPEIITTGHDGLLVPPCDPESLAAAIARLMDDPELAARLARNARATIVERFDSRIGAATLYRRLTGSDPPAEAPFLDFALAEPQEIA
jgi:glycosyltransferase involved in cell wall biosynthesis